MSGAKSTLFLLVVSATAALALPAAATARAHDPFRRTIGSYLGGSNTGVCAVQAPATVRRCTLAQSNPKVERYAGYGRYPHVRGHIVRFRLTTGRPTPDTTSVRVRFHALAGPRGPGGPVSRWFALSLEGRRRHEFAVRVPFAPGSRIAVDVEVHGDGRGEAAAPIAAAGKPVDGTYEWSPPLGPGAKPPLVIEGRSINLNAVFERDDQTPPILHYSYAKYQDFLRTRRVYVDVRSNEFVLFNPECSLLTREAQWGLVGAIPHLRPRRTHSYFCELEPPALRAGLKAARRGGNPRVFFRLVAYDRAGNVARTKAFYVYPTD
ncbi:MAG TPA: hypothetical protein VMH33_03735 [Solirubrobacterales bacterium]|nr:hypothetical protein [Solirubrobacterales bacterium]